MSHSTVIVMGDNPEEMLVPYDENINVPEYRAYEENCKEPKDHFIFEKAVEEGKITVDCSWPDFIVHLNERWPGEGGVGFDEERGCFYSMSTYNPKSKWDWYQLGGRRSGFWKPRDGAQMWHKWSPGAFGASGSPDHWVDQIHKGDIDFDGMRAQAEAEAISTHAQVRAALADTPPLVSWAHVREVMFPDDITMARNVYHAQPGMIALRESKLDSFFSDPVVTYFLNEKDPAAAYVAHEVAQVGIPFAILNENGWHEKGNMGWFGIVSDEVDNWNETARRLIDAAPDDTLFSLFDVHI